MALDGGALLGDEQTQQFVAVVVGRDGDVLLEGEVAAVHRVRRRVGERPRATLAQLEEHHPWRLLHELGAAVARPTPVVEFLHEHLVGDVPLAGFRRGGRLPLDAMERLGARRPVHSQRRLVHAHGGGGGATRRPRGVVPVAAPRVVEAAHARSRRVADAARARARERHHRPRRARLQPARADLVVVDAERRYRAGHVADGVQAEVVVRLADVSFHVGLQVLEEVGAERLLQRRRVAKDPHVPVALVAEEDEGEAVFAPVRQTQRPLRVVHVHALRHAVLVPEVEVQTLAAYALALHPGLALVAVAYALAVERVKYPDAESAL